MPTFILSTPPSVNALYVNVGRFRKKTPRYKAWIDGELKALVAHRAKPILPPVSIKIVLPRIMRGDADNRIKPTLDLLVRAGIIPDDNTEIVRRVLVLTGDVEMMHVTVETITAESVAA